MDLIWYIFGSFVGPFIMVIVYYKWCFEFWKKRGVYSVTPSIPFGNIGNVVAEKITISEQLQSVYDQIKIKNERHGGLYFLAVPIYMPVDPEIIKTILQTDFNHFVNHGMFFNEEVDPLSAHLFNIEDAKWRQLRAKLTPTFASAKLKEMFQTIVDCTKGLVQAVEENKNSAIDINEYLGCYTADVIGSCAFGLECNSFAHHDDSFRKYCKQEWEVSTYRAFQYLIAYTFPWRLLRWINIRLTDKSVSDFFVGKVKETVNYREQNNVYRKDFMHLLLQLKNRGKIADDGLITKQDNENGNYLTINEVIAQAFLFFAAGFETSSTTMTFALHELSKNPKIQEKLRKEIKTVLKKHGGMTYESIKEMQYLDKIISETLRKRTPLGFLNRMCSDDYKVPNSDLVLKKGTRVIISTDGLHQDPDHYPNPEEFDPERFSEEKKSERHQFVYIPFGNGPRNCIGYRFGLMQVKVGLVSLLNKYSFSVNSKTEEPLQMDPKKFTRAAKTGIFLNVH